MKKLLFLILIAGALFLSARANDITWQESFYDILANKTDSMFMLFDVDLDGIPELFVIDGHTDEVLVYAFRNGTITTIKHGDEISLTHLLRGAARTIIGPPPQGVEGFVFANTGPSAGLFGTSRFFWRVVLYDTQLIIADFGEIYVDINGLHEKFDNFGFDADETLLQTAIEENTHIRINGDPTTKAELFELFGETIPRFSLYEANKANIHALVFGWR